MTNVNFKRVAQISFYLLLTAGPLGNVHAADDGINTHAPYLTFDPDTGKFVEVDPSKTGAAGQGGGQNTAAAQGAGASQNAAAQTPAASQNAPPAAQGAGQSAASGQATPAADNPSLLTLVGAVVMFGVLGVLIWSRRRKKEAATSA